MQTELRGENVRAARAMLRWSVATTAAQSGVSPRTIVRVESVDGVVRMIRLTREALLRTFDAAGIEFACGGVRLREK